MNNNTETDSGDNKLSKINESTVSVEKTHNPEREGVVRLLHLFFQEQQQHTPTHRRYAELDEKKHRSIEEEKEIESLKKKIFVEKIDIARQILLHSDAYNYLLSVGTFEEMSHMKYEAMLRFGSKIKIPNYSYETNVVYFSTAYQDFMLILSDIKKKYNISQEEWEKVQEIEWSDSEKDKLHTLQKSAEGYKKDWEGQKVNFEGHSFSEAASQTMKNCLLQGFITAEYNKSGLPKVHEGRVITDLMTGQLGLQKSE